MIAPTSEQPLAATRTFGQPLLGTVGEVTAEVVEESGVATWPATGQG